MHADTETETAELPFHAALINMVCQLGKIPDETTGIEIPKDAGESFGLAFAATAVEAIADKDLAKIASYIAARTGFKPWLSKTKTSEKRDRLRTYMVSGLKTWDEADSFELVTHAGAVLELQQRAAAALPAKIEVPSSSSNPNAINSPAATAARKARRKKPVAETIAPTALSQGQRNIVQQWAKSSLVITDAPIDSDHPATEQFMSELLAMDPDADPRLRPLVAAELELCRVRIGAQLDSEAAAKPKRRSKKDQVIDAAVAAIPAPVEAAPADGPEAKVIAIGGERAPVIAGDSEDPAATPRKKRSRDEAIYELANRKSIDELRAMYEEIYDRKTKANHKRVLAWRIVLGQRAIADGHDPKANMPAPRGTPALRLTLEEVRALITVVAPKAKGELAPLVEKLVSFAKAATADEIAELVS